MDSTKTFIIGDGNMVISGVGKDGLQGIALYELPVHGYEVDTPVPAEAVDNLPQVHILVKDLKAMRLLQDQVNAIALRMNGYEVDNL
jgi:hypothetical protein